MILLGGYFKEALAMEVETFIEYLAENPEIYEWQEGEHDNKQGIFVKNNQFETKTHFTLDAIQKNDLPVLMNQTNHGKNVEHITRVTGFFSKVQSWNKGKRGELKNRYRVNDLDK
jgi:hypothetical protein